MNKYKIPTKWGPLSKSIEFDNFKRNILFSERESINEILSALEFVSEVEENGLKFVGNFGCVDTEGCRRIYLLFQSYIRQATTFFKSAQTLNYRSSSLIYYYSFLNFFKAYLILNNRNLDMNHIHHGLKHSFEDTCFEKQVVTVSNGVFKEFYKSNAQCEIEEKTELNISQLLGYILNLSHEFLLCEYGELKYAHGIERILSDDKRKKAWVFIALSKTTITENYQSNIKGFSEYFEEVDFESIDGHDLMDICGFVFPDTVAYRYFQSKKEYDFKDDIFMPILSINKDYYACLRNYYVPNIYNTKCDFNLFEHLSEEPYIPFNEMFAIYVDMFYLGSLVRYNPAYLEGLLNSKHSWIIESFVNNSSLTFVRYICNLILKKWYVFDRYG